MIKLIVGLGNPGSQYAKTRHNAGVWFLEALADKFGVSWRVDSKFHGLTSQFQCEQVICRSLIPTTYMNLSGQAVQALAQFYQMTPEEILVVHDELDLAAGVTRLKFEGGHGGHNGLRDIFEKLGSQKFYRLRVGIGRSTTEQKNVDFVLSAPPESERTLINESFGKVLKVLPLLLKGEFSGAMKELNTQTTNNLPKTENHHGI
jgi:PTH1 family peptidyl-tRNA hydrolase